MDEQVSASLVGREALMALAELGRLMAGSNGTTGETIGSILAELTRIFDGEGALLFIVDDEHQTLQQRHRFHNDGASSPAFQSEAEARCVFFGDGAVGRTWSEGQAELFQLPPPPAGAPLPGEPVYGLTVPLLAGGTIYGVVELIGVSLDTLTEDDLLFLQVLALQLGGYVAGHNVLERTHRQREHLDHALRRMKVLDNEVRESKARLARVHDDMIHQSVAEQDYHARLSRELRTPLGGILSIVELLQRTALTQPQQELVRIIADSAANILTVLQSIVETEERQAELVSVQAAESTASGGRAAKQLADARVLVVPGLVGSAELIGPFAQSAGLSCQAAFRGHSALVSMRQALAIGRPFDVVFVERVLPDMDSFEFVRLVRNDEDLRPVRLVLVSTFGASGPIDEAVEAGFDAHVSKPIKQAQVLNCVQALLRGTSVEAAMQSPQSNLMPALIKGKPVILVAEDNPVNQKVALLQLQELGFFAEVVPNGIEAVEAAKQGLFDAILMDCQMPEMNGYDATRQIREWEKQSDRHIPIIAMTAHALPADRDRCFAAGMDDYMSKPVTYEKLDSVLARWLHMGQFPAAEEKTMDHNTQSSQNLDFAPDQSAPVDVNMLADLLGADETADILKLFVESSNELIEKIHRSVQEKDEQALREAAHTLKGACSSIGANEMWRECLELEQAARSSDWQKIPEMCTALEISFDAARSFINTTFS